jgi:hypothetical protein
VVVEGLLLCSRFSFGAASMVRWWFGVGVVGGDDRGGGVLVVAGLLSVQSILCWVQSWCGEVVVRWGVPGWW